jgi:hypothetical protein
MAESGVAHKVISVILRLAELASAIIVLGILSRICYLVGIAQANVDGRIIYAIVVACLGIMYSIFFCPPFKNMFLGFPFDFLLFVMWLVAYCLLQTVLFPPLASNSPQRDSTTDNMQYSLFTENG